MNDSAYATLLDRLESPGDLGAAEVDLVLAAAEGAEELGALVDGAPAPPRRPAAADAPAATSRRVYLEALEVENFRGIGPKARLPLEPGPGLTLVVGRNGSGKSSFAEGLELLLTGTNQRWEGRTKVWQSGWRNLHGEGATRIGARFRVDGQADPLELARSWPDGAKLDGAGPLAVRGAASWEALGWDEPLERLRPLLSYNELSSMFSTRAAALYEALSAVLGLQDFDELAAVLRAARLERERSGKAEAAARKALRPQLEGLDDDRARTVAALLAKRSPDLEAVELVAVDEAGGGEERGDLRALATMTVPDRRAVDAAFAAFERSVREVDALETTDAHRSDALAALLETALGFHERHGDEQTCPVCGTPDVLDPGWSLRSQATIQELRRDSASLQDARGRRAQARRALGELLSSGTPALLRAGAAAGLDVEPAQAAWDRWAEQLRAGDAQLLRDGPAAAGSLGGALEAVRSAAAAAEEDRDRVWTPVRGAVLEWLATARKAARDKEAVGQLKACEAWVGELTAALRRDRLAPIVEAAQRNWSLLRHESNVALGNVELRKEGTQRYASFDVSVDGTGSSAFGVMSQGELSALAVSVFLPRASLPQSPFGFMVIDDPVQSMDPAKVDGLARVLAGAAADRQVVVFTHDARLPEAVSRLGIDARIIQVQRRARSRVEIVAGRPPSDRYIGEAMAIARTPDLPDEVRARVVPGICGNAIEAACAARIRRRSIAAGVPFDAVEEALAEHTSITAWLAAAFDLTAAQGRELAQTVERLAGTDAVEAVRTIRRGRHELVAADGLRLAEGARSLVRAIEAA